MPRRKPYTREGPVRVNKRVELVKAAKETAKWTRSFRFGAPKAEVPLFGHSNAKEKKKTTTNDNRSVVVVTNHNKTAVVTMRNCRPTQVKCYCPFLLDHVREDGEVTLVLWLTEPVETKVGATEEKGGVTIVIPPIPDSWVKNSPSSLQHPDTKWREFYLVFGDRFGRFPMRGKPNTPADQPPDAGKAPPPPFPPNQLDAAAHVAPSAPIPAPIPVVEEAGHDGVAHAEEEDNAFEQKENKEHILFDVEQPAQPMPVDDIPYPAAEAQQHPLAQEEHLDPELFIGQRGAHPMPFNGFRFHFEEHHWQYPPEQAQSEANLQQVPDGEEHQNPLIHATQEQYLLNGDPFLPLPLAAPMTLLEFEALYPLHADIYNYNPDA